MAFDVGIINTIVKVGEIITQPITDKWFYWAMLTFILHHKDWKYASFNIAIFMWVVHSIALMYPKVISFIGENTENKMDDLKKWRFEDVPQFIFYYLSEIIGDWYIFFILVKYVPRSKYGIAGLLCIISNFIKVLICVVIFSEEDGCKVTEGNPKPAGFNCFRDSELWQKYQKLECLNILFTALYYGTCFIMFKSAKDEHENQNKLNPSSFTIVKKFRRDSKYRMMLSSIFALVSCCFAIPFIKDTFTHNFEFRLEVTREAIMSLSYYMIYIDQILKSEQSGGQAFRSTSNDPTSSFSNTKSGFSSKGVLDNSKIHDGTDFGATPWNNNSNFNYSSNYNNY
ncbi:hypothetical protein BCR36DRAFT_325918 [Piromyces finnis]|uniref:Uncharacterized protein n=1 Tax=Piromyces finnis TaxID=1754191 RepID=A0A1Y1VAY5_9FUNG|nr:hypothetical protein BCR36DRAFT_325918 [Piromyces finnis]|eukprot:ORX51514.1 hypothetical protein BCR36DRAFT_325918 [Piromyces finnis]